MGDGAEHGVVVEAAPGPSFEVIQAELALHLLVVALDAPAKLGETHEFAERSRRRKR